MSCKNSNEVQNQANETTEGRFITVKNIDKDQVKQNTGYEIQTDLFKDLSGLEVAYGQSYVREYVNKLYKEWKNDIRLTTELAFILKLKCTQHYWGQDKQYYKFYQSLYRKVYKLGEKMSAEDATHFYATLG